MDVCYVLIPVDSVGNMGGISNVVTVYVPRVTVIGQSDRNNSPIREGLFDPFITNSAPNPSNDVCYSGYYLCSYIYISSDRFSDHCPQEKVK